MSNKPLAAIGNPHSGRCPCISEHLETVRFLNEENPSSRSRSGGRYTTKIQHIVGALLAGGYTSLDAQAKALGIPRATAWTFIRNKRKLDRLNTNTTNRILANPELPLCVRAVIQQYVAERPVLGGRRKMQAVETRDDKEHIYEGGARCEGPHKTPGQKRGRFQSSQRYAQR